MKVPHIAASYKRLRSEAAWRLLAADNAPVAIALLDAHLFASDRRLPASIFAQRVERDLDGLRAEGWSLPQPAQAYIAQWLADGFLSRSLDASAAEEIYELTAPAMQALRFAQSLTHRRAAATESRLSLVIRQLADLAEQTETDPESRIEMLIQERRRIDAEIAAARAGRLETLSRSQALERIREIVGLADELANDFRQVRDEFGQLNRQLRERVMDAGRTRSGILDELFAGIDVIAGSDAGRTFRAFWALLTDPEQSASLDESLETVLSRPFARDLSIEERRFLTHMTRVLLERGGDVHETLRHFARSLKQFVQSREFLEQRRVTALLREAQAQALQLKDLVKPTDSIHYSLPLTSSRLSSVAQSRLYDPSLDRVNPGLAPAQAAEISLEAVSELLAHSEIDFRTLETHVRTLLATRQQVSIAEVLHACPAEQGLGSVIGYLALGVRHGVRADGHETVSWRGLMDGVHRSARIPCIYFVKGGFA